MENVEGRKELPRNPRERANILSHVLFWYTNPVFKKSKKKEIGMEDLYAVLKTHKSDDLGDRMSDAWEKERLTSSGKNKEPSLLSALLSVFGWKIAALGVMLAGIEFLLRWVPISNS